MTPAWVISGGVLLLAYAAVWYFFMASPARRSLRSILFLAATSPLLAVAALADFPLSLMGGGFIACLWLAGLWDLGHVLAPFEPAEVRFDESLGRIRRQVRDNERGIPPGEWHEARDAHLRVLENAITEIHSLDPPSTEWAELRESLARTLEFDATVYRGDRSPDNAAAGESFARWAMLKQEWDAVRSARSNFTR